MTYQMTKLKMNTSKQVLFNYFGNLERRMYK